MKQKQKPLSFSLHPDNIAYIESAVLGQKEVNHRYSRSMYLDDLITHLRNKAAAKDKPEYVKAIVKTLAPAKPKRVTFKAPTVEEVRNYCDERCNNVDAQNFVDHYTGNGWVRGKNKIKDWKACVRTWENKDKPKVKVTENLGGNW
tara:strand:+ start:733 stop:1170 length:438 start_codon:yes stop_codon:yes gene_type:complete